jgi:hypothetical protein
MLVSCLGDGQLIACHAGILGASLIAVKELPSVKCFLGRGNMSCAKLQPLVPSGSPTLPAADNHKQELDICHLKA